MLNNLVVWIITKIFGIYEEWDCLCEEDPIPTDNGMWEYTMTKKQVKKYFLFIHYKTILEPHTKTIAMKNE